MSKMQPSADLSQYNLHKFVLRFPLFVLNKSSPTDLKQFFRLDRKRQHNVATEFQCQHYLSNY